MPHRPVLRNLHHKRALLPLSGAEHQLLRNLQLSDESVRVLDDLLAVSKGMTMRKILFTVLRMIERNLASHAPYGPSPAPEGNAARPAPANPRPQRPVVASPSAAGRPLRTGHQVVKTAPTPATITKLDAVLDQLGPRS